MAAMARIRTGNTSNGGNSIRRIASEASGSSKNLITQTHSENVRKKAMLRQILLTLVAAVMILAAFLAKGGNFVVTHVSTSGALRREAVEIRRRVAQSVMDEVALTLKAAHDITMRLALRASAGPGTAQRIWPLTADVIENHLEEVLGNIFALQGDSLLRRVDPTSGEKEYVPTVGAAVHIGVEEDLRTPTTNLRECAAVLRAGLFTAESTGDGGLIVTSNPIKRAHYSDITEVNGTREAKIRWTLYDSEAKRLVNTTLAFQDVPTCKEDSTIQMDWSEGVTFRWDGPFPDSMRWIQGAAPFRNEEGLAIGYVATGLSVVFSFNPVLNKILKDGGDLTNGAELAVISQSGLLLAMSGADTTNWQKFAYKLVTDIPANTALGQAVRYLQSEAGNPCPAWHTAIEEGERLIDALPVSVAEYGVPPPEEMWCVIQTYPRENMYEAIDRAMRTTFIAGVSMVVLLTCAILLFVASLLSALRSEHRLREDDVKEDTRLVIAAVRDVQLLNCPMALVSAADFLGLSRMEQHEALRDMGVLTILDSVEAIEAFKENNLILFFSHQWLSFDYPDNSRAAQLEAMKRAIQNLASPQKDLYIWCDYSSISQRHPKMQREAIASLPVYARIADKFIILAPPAIHENLLTMCNLATYSKRGWCRAEMLAKACGSGIENMYTCTDHEGTLSPVTSDDLSRLSLNVFQGKFTVAEDVETLVKPVLGLYSLVLLHRDLPHMRKIHKHIGNDKDRFFPESYHSDAAGAKVKLFGKCIEFLETYIEARMHGEKASQVLNAVARQKSWVRKLRSSGR